MSIAELSPGDKLSLKGKIFELQKKLNLLDVEQQNTEDYSFRPEITSYQLPQRQSGFIDNMEKSERNRKERFESLKEMVKLETSIDCTFSPEINNSSKVRKSEKPAHLRLYEKGKEYKAGLEKKKKLYTKYDANGRRLFHPQSLSRKPRSAEGNMQVEEYLYRDAQDRAERREITIEEEKKQQEQFATEKKMNKKSEALVKRRNERLARFVFDLLLHPEHIDKDSSDTGGEGGTEPEKIHLSHLQTLIETIQTRIRALETKCNVPMRFPKTVITAAKDQYALSQRIWQCLDPTESGEVGVDEFLGVCMPILMTRGGSVANTLVSSSCVRDLDTSLTKQTDSTLIFQFLVAVQTHSSDLSGTPASPGTHSSKNMKPVASSPRRGKCASTEPPTHRQTTVSARDRVEKYNRTLSERERATSLRMEQLKNSLYEEEMKECTFRPHITTTAERCGGVPYPQERKSATADSDDWSEEDMSRRTSGSVYDRLYSQKDKVPKSIAKMKHRPLEEREMDGCTFTPHMYRPPAAPNSGTEMTSPSSGKRKKNVSSLGNLMMSLAGGESQASVPPPPAPKGFSESVMRIRNALERRKQKEKEDEEFFAVNDASYERNRQKLAEKGCQPFRLRTEERQAEKIKAMSAKSHISIDQGAETAASSRTGSMKGYVRRDNGEIKPVRLYVEIKLGGGVKGSHIAVADNDVPSELARAFCRIYSLDAGAEKILTEVVTANMIEGDIPIGPSSVQPAAQEDGRLQIQVDDDRSDKSNPLDGRDLG